MGNLAMGINFGVLGLVATAVAGFASGEPGGYKSFKGWPSDASLMSSHTSPCDIKSYKAKLLAGEGYYFDSGTAAGWCRTIPVKNVPKVRAAHVINDVSEWSGSDHATGKTYLPKKDAKKLDQISKKFDVSASARCSSVVAGTKPGTMDCNPAQETCSTAEVPWMRPGKKGYKSYCREAFDPVHKAKVECPDGIGPVGYYTAYYHPKHLPPTYGGYCSQWETAVGQTICDRAFDQDPKLVKTCTKAKVIHMRGLMPRSVGALLFKRNVCVGARCTEWKTGRCIDVHEVVWDCDSHHRKRNCGTVGYCCPFKVNNKREGRKKFARLAV